MITSDIVILYCLRFEKWYLMSTYWIADHTLGFKQTTTGNLNKVSRSTYFDLIFKNIKKILGYVVISETRKTFCILNIMFVLGYITGSFWMTKWFKINNSWPHLQLTGTIPLSYWWFSNFSTLLFSIWNNIAASGTWEWIAIRRWFVRLKSVET